MTAQRRSRPGAPTQKPRRQRAAVSSTRAVDDVLELVVGNFAAGGSFVARAPDGRVVFVRHALSGERVRARIVEEHAKFLRADAVEILEASPDRVEPPCPYAGVGRCGGCDLQHVALGAQRVLKADLLSEQLWRIAKIDAHADVEELPGAPDGLNWRTRVRYTIDPNGHVGFRRSRSHELEVVSDCAVASQQIAELELSSFDFAGATELEIFAPAGKEGTSKDAVISIAGSPRLLDPRVLMELPAKGVGLIVDDKSVASPSIAQVELAGRAFQISPTSFWQVHAAAPETLAKAVMTALEPATDEHVLDLYAGVGLFSVLIADAVGPTGSVISVEQNASAIADLRVNAADQVHHDVRSARVSPELIASLARIDAVVLDPPREGAGAAVMHALSDVSPRPRVIVYVACDPATFARDLKVLLERGWHLDQLRAFDLFPMTEHLEAMAVLRP